MSSLMVSAAEDYQIARRRFLGETLRLTRLGCLVVVPIKLPILRMSWKIVEKHHVHQADALQIVSAKSVNADEFLVADRRLHQVALEEGLNSKYTG